MAILFISGVNDHSLVGVDLDERGQLVHLMDGNCSIQYRLPLREGVAVSLTIFGKGVQQRMPEFKTAPSLIFNQIADADTHRGALERCLELCESVNCPVINHPRQVQQTGRERVSECLQGITGLTMPRILRVQSRSPDHAMELARSASLGFPFIVRVAGEHQGKGMIRVDSPADTAALHALPFDGRDFYLVEYVDFRDADDGLYHKHRIVVVDGEPLLRHALYLDDWMVHANSRAFMMQRDSWENDVARFNRLSTEVLPRARPALDEVTRRLGLDYYGIDCSLRADGSFVVFEANANMNVLHSPNAASRYRVETIEQKLYALLEARSGERVI